MSTATEVKERPIIFSAPMVRAILSGAKTQTRRVVKPQPRVSSKWTETSFDGGAAFIFPPPRSQSIDDGSYCKIPSRYGAPGDRLWVKEAWATLPLNKRFYRADGEMHGEWKWRSSLFMPRLASRITLEIVDVRVERLNVITEADAKAEGFAWNESTAVGWGDGAHRHPVLAFSETWDKLNGKTHPWSSNCWVWVIEFKRIEP